MLKLQTLFYNIYVGKRSLIIFIFCVSILFSSIFLLFFSNIGPVQHRLPGTDYLLLYKPVAENILQGKGITIDGRIAVNIGLGFPVILSGIFALSRLIGINELDLIVVFNVIFTAIAVCLLFFIAKEIFNKKIALITALMWASYLFNLWFLKNPNTEVPFIPLLYLGILFYILALKKKKLRFAFLGGMTLGLSSSIRLISLFLPSFLALLFFIFLKNVSKKKQILFAVILLMGNIAAIMPWAVYMFSETGSFLPISSLGSRGLVYGVLFLSRAGEGGDRAWLPNDVDALIGRMRAENLSSWNQIFKFFSWQFKENPFTVLRLAGLKLVRFLYATSQNWWEGRILAFQSLYLITSFGGILYIIRKDRAKIRDAVFLLSIVFYFWGMAFVNVSVFRYMVPVMGLVMIFSAITVSVILDKLLSKTLKKS